MLIRVRVISQHHVSSDALSPSSNQHPIVASVCFQNVQDVAVHLRTNWPSGSPLTAADQQQILVTGLTFGLPVNMRWRF